jgi:hypothetical protein
MNVHAIRSRTAGNKLALMRVVWIALAVLSLTLFSAGIPARWNQLVTPCPVLTNCIFTQLTTLEADALAQNGWSIYAYAMYFVALEIIFAIVFALIGAIIAWRKSDDVFSLFVSITLITFGAAIPPPMRTLDTDSATLSALIHTLQSFGWVSFFTFLYIFPNGEFVPRWTRWRPFLFIAWAVGWVLMPDVNLFNWPVPIAVAVMFVVLTSGVIAQVYRYVRVSERVQRQQTKWVVMGFIGSALGIAAFLIPPELAPMLRDPGLTRVVYQLIAVPVFAGALLLIPASIGVAITRYRLFEIDFVIRRTLIYGVLTTLLALVYLVFVVAMLVVLGPTIGWLTDDQLIPVSDLVFAMATLVCVALVSPLHRRVQNTIDRRFYPRKYDAARVLAAFSLIARDQVDLQDLAERLVGVVHETVEPTHVSLWLRKVSDQ